jgi:hypothetical protein
VEAELMGTTRNLEKIKHAIVETQLRIRQCKGLVGWFGSMRGLDPEGMDDSVTSWSGVVEEHKQTLDALQRLMHGAGRRVAVGDVRCSLGRYHPRIEVISVDGETAKCKRLPDGREKSISVWTLQTTYGLVHRAGA